MESLSLSLSSVAQELWQPLSCLSEQGAQKLSQQALPRPPSMSALMLRVWSLFAWVGLVAVLSACVSVTGACEGQKRALGSLKEELRG